MDAKRSFMTMEEKTFLKEIVTRHSDIVECKKTNNAVFVSQKKMWHTIAHEFNAIGEHSNRTLEELKKCWENMKRKKQLNVEKINRMATDGGPYKSSSDESDVDDLLNSVDIEIKDSINSDASAASMEETTYLLQDNLVRAPIVHEKPKDLPNIEGCSTQNVEIKTPRNKSRGTAIKKELEVRIARMKRCYEQDEELHKLRVEEQLIRIEIAKKILKQEKIKTNKLLEQFNTTK